jgi:protein ImuB
MGRILCAWSPTWAIDNWRRRNRSAAQAEAPVAPPFALVETARGTRRLYAADAIARAAGLYAGQKAADALALTPDLVLAEAAPEADARALAALVDWCVRFSPAVAGDQPDGLFLDITGVSHLWAKTGGNGEAEMLADFADRLAAGGLPMRCAIADTPGAAWALAHYGSGAVIAPPGGQAALIAPLPPAALRLEAQAAVQIERLGLRRIEQLIALPRGPFARRFGQAAMDRLDQALGRGREALTFQRPPSPWVARLAFAEPISAPEDFARVAHDITAGLCRRLEAEGKGARRFELAYHRLDGKALTATAGLALPGREAVRIARLLVPKLDVLDPGFGVEVVTLQAFDVETLTGRQGRLDAERAPSLEEGLAPLVDRLANRLGAERVWRPQAVESHVPERSAGHARPLAPAEPPAWDPETPRPLRLFKRPEALEAVAALVPDDPPVRFQWRGRTHRVTRAEGPERIGAEWWKGAIEDVSVERFRDYYRVEDEAGARFWLFRAGPAGARWWLHGLFG